jgi:3-deoxy-manno-octulosonate cytidylyltransferase (CMP-KDO synthetase)
MQKKTLVIIPSRIGSTRLAKKALVKIGDKTMVEHVALQVITSKLDNIYVATDDKEISDVLNQHGINSIMTDSNCHSGTDRVYAAWQRLPNKGDFEYLINVQGDMPFIEPSIISTVANCLWKSKCDIVTPVAKVELKDALSDSNVKVVSTLDNRALYFSRSLIPNGATEFLYHVGVYGYKAASLEKLVKLPVSYLEKTERLEQLRALENGMSIEICEVDTIPTSIDTADDLQKALAYFNSTK